jgi:dissimilatory sulfite reductase (desulfoviridin) alpha/beta subunit
LGVVPIVYVLANLVIILIGGACGSYSGREGAEGGCVNDERERHLRWMEILWERYQSIAREEKRIEEILGIFEEIAELSKRPIEVPPLSHWGAA